MITSKSVLSLLAPFVAVAPLSAATVTFFQGDTDPNTTFSGPEESGPNGMTNDSGQAFFVTETADATITLEIHSIPDNQAFINSEDGENNENSQIPNVDPGTGAGTFNISADELVHNLRGGGAGAGAYYILSGRG